MKILVIAPTAFHLGYLGCYGNAWIETPHLDALAAESAVFDNHYSDCPNGYGAWRAWRTGRFQFPTLAPEPVPLASNSFDLLALLRTHAIPSLLVTDKPEASGSNDSNDWQEITPIPTGEKGEEYSKILRKTILKSIRTLEPHDHGLIWVETNLLTPPWSVNESSPNYFSNETDDEPGDDPIELLSQPESTWLDPTDDRMYLRLQNSYATAISHLDCVLGEVFDEFRQRDLFNEFMIIVTTDRGFPLGEHGLVGDVRPWLHDEFVHIPLIIRLPGENAVGRRIAALTQPGDLMPTVLEALAIATPPTHGSSLLPLIRGQQDRIRDFVCSGLRIEDALEWALRTADWAFLLPEFQGGIDPTRDRQLYVKPDDRWEVNNVWQHHPEVAEHLEKILRASVKGSTSEAQR
jgi:arylsulfatase A-like enzyme